MCCLMPYKELILIIYLFNSSTLSSLCQATNITDMWGIRSQGQAGINGLVKEECTKQLTSQIDEQMNLSSNLDRMRNVMH